jgi:hypothetical protein
MLAREPRSTPELLLPARFGSAFRGEALNALKVRRQNPTVCNCRENASEGLATSQNGAGILRFGGDVWPVVGHLPTLIAVETWQGLSAVRRIFRR